MDIATKLGLVLFGVFISGVGYFIKRKIEGTGNIESLDKHKKLLDIHKQMVDQDIDMEGLKNLEAKIAGKASQIQINAAVLRSESTPLISENEPELLTQLEMSQRAATHFENAKKKMQEAIAGIDSRVGDDRSQALIQSQVEWESYSVSQAESAAASYSEGSIYPLIYYSELESLTNERTARLQAEVDELIRLGN